MTLTVSLLGKRRLAACTYRQFADTGKIASTRIVDAKAAEAPGNYRLAAVCFPYIPAQQVSSSASRIRKKGPPEVERAIPEGNILCKEEFSGPWDC